MYLLLHSVNENFVNEDHYIINKKQFVFFPENFVFFCHLHGFISTNNNNNNTSTNVLYHFWPIGQVYSSATIHLNITEECGAHLVQDKKSIEPMRNNTHLSSFSFLSSFHVDSWKCVFLSVPSSKNTGVNVGMCVQRKNNGSYQV